MLMFHNVPFECPLPDGTYTRQELLAHAIASEGDALAHIDAAYQLTLVKRTPCVRVENGVCVELCDEATHAPPPEPTAPIKRQYRRRQFGDQ